MQGAFLNDAFAKVYYDYEVVITFSINCQAMEDLVEAIAPGMCLMLIDVELLTSVLVLV